MKDELSPTMRSALACAKAYGGKIVRYPGGYWAREGWMQNGDRSASYGTSTIQGLVDRERLEYTKFQQHKKGGGSFPIEATVKPRSDKGKHHEVAGVLQDDVDDAEN